MVSLSPNIGKIAGITIQIHWILVALLVIALLTPLIPGVGFYLLIVVVLLYVSVLLHELTHSLVSKHNHIRVKKIILLPIGGASIIDIEKVKPDVEFRIAISGPLTSIVLGIIFGIIWFYVPTTGLLNQVLLFMFEINLLLGAFNLLPGFPLDGGRVLRSYLQRKHSFMESTQLAVRASNWVVVALIVGTIAYAVVIPNATFVYREFVVFWDVIIALFLYDGARAELQSAVLKGYTDKMKASDMASGNYILVGKGMSTDDLYKEMLDRGTRVVLLKKGNKLMKATDKQLAKLMESQGMIAGSSSHYFTIEVPQIWHDEKLSKVIETMRNDEVDTIAVMKNSKLSGILYAPNIEAALQMYLARAQKAKTAQSR